MMDDVIWGDVIHAVDLDVVDVHVTYLPTMNRGQYKTLERIRLMSPDNLGPAMKNMPLSDSGFIHLLDQEINSANDLVGRHLLLRVLERNDQDDLHCELNLIV